jgi:hypothetical protein
MLFNIAFSDFFKAINKPFDKKKIGYAGKIKADIFKYIEPYAITSELDEKNLGIISAVKYTIAPENNIKYKPYLTDVK